MNKPSQLKRSPRNQDIRTAIEQAGLRHWWVAEELGIACGTLSNRLRKELPPGGKAGGSGRYPAIGGPSGPSHVGVSPPRGDLGDPNHPSRSGLAVKAEGIPPEFLVIPFRRGKFPLEKLKRRGFCHTAFFLLRLLRKVIHSFRRRRTALGCAVAFQPRWR